MKYYTMVEFAKVLNVSRHTVKRWIDDGELEYLKYGNTYKIPATALETRKGE